MAVKYLLAFGVIAIAQVYCGESQGPEKELAGYLLKAAKNAGTYGRPVKNVGDSMDVEIGLTLVQLVEADKAGLVTVQAFLQLGWKDPALSWDPEKFGGAATSLIPSDKVWRPDVSVWNSVLQGSSANTKDMLEAYALVMSDGSVMWVPNMLYKVPCNKNEVGELACEVIAGSWAHDTTQMNIKFIQDKADIDVSFVLPHDGFELTSHSAERVDKEYECCPGPKFSTVHFKFNIKQTGDGTCTKL